MQPTATPSTPHTLLQGLLDLHLHTAPDVRPRRYSDEELANLARSLGVCAVVIKNHHGCTVERAKLASKNVPGVRVFGSITLNKAMGGLEPGAVLSACKSGARIVWLPTLDAANHRRREGKQGGIELLEAGKLLPVVREIVQIVGDWDVALATGHISPDEIDAVVEAASVAGLRRIVVTHPEHSVVGLSHERQHALAGAYPIYFERCYAQPVSAGRYHCNVETNLEALRAVGLGSSYLATDSGQVESAPWDEAWQHILAALQRAGHGEETIRYLTRDVPAFIVGLRNDRPAVPPAPAALPKSPLPA